MDITINAVVSESTSAFLVGYDFIYNVQLYLPSIVNSSTVLPFEVTAEQAVFLEGTIITNTSKGKRFNLQLGGGWVLSSKVGKSESNVRNFAISLGEKVAINHTLFSANSQFLDYTLKLNVADMINFNDDVYLLVLDKEQNFKIYRGLVRDKTIKDKRINVKAVLGEGILSERIIKQDYDEQDVGLTVKQIIETYCSPLTAEGVNTNTGYIAPIIAKYKTALQVIESIRREYGLFYFIGYDWDFNLYRDDEITEPDAIEIRLGD